MEPGVRDHQCSTYLTYTIDPLIKYSKGPEQTVTTTICIGIGTTHINMT